MFFSYSCSSSHTNGLANLGERCKCGVASAAADAARTAAMLATDSDDTVDVAASTAVLSLIAIQ
jgi:hypothetical protein